MASYQRIALYVVFDAIERDLIQFIRRSIPVSDGTLLSQEENTRARQRITKRERDNLYNLDDPYDLLHGLDLGDKFDLILRYKHELSVSDKEYILALKPQFDKAVPVRADVMHGRPLTLDDYIIGFAFGNELSKRPDIWPELAASLVALQRNPNAIVSQPIMVLDEEHSTRVLNNLPKVDYDDTGFVPRPRLEAELKQKILGRHPVITVLGEGGNGKSALTLQTAYRLVYSDDHNFDAIIWVSAKSSELTVKEIKRISDAITTSIDLFDSIAEFEPGGEDPISRVTRLLAENKILLIIDNLETVLDRRIRNFAEDVPGDSKLVFTSRVPLGGDLPVRVTEFSETEAERFLRRLIDAYCIDSLKGLTSEHLKRHINRLNHKPLLIKWFALGVLSGLTSESITRNPELALRFCLENVVSTLDEPTRKVALVFALVSGSHSALIIQYLTDLSSHDVEAAIATLLRYALIEDNSKNPYERTYSMRVFARSYLSTIEKAQPDFVKSLQVSYARIGGIFESQRQVSSVNRYIPGHYMVRSRSEAIAATQLAQAFQKSERDDFDGALKIIDDLRITAPEYFEVYRTAAIIHLNAGNIPLALQNYEVAIEIDQNQPQLFFWFGGFVMRYLNDSVRASTLFDEALKLDPKSSAVLREAARNEFLVPDFEKAQSLLDRAMELELKSHKETVIICDLQAQLYIRKASAFVQAGDYKGGIEILETLRAFIDKLDRTYIDRRFIEHISKTRTFCLRTLELRAPIQHQSRVYELTQWVDNFVTIRIQTLAGQQIVDQIRKNAAGPSLDEDEVYVGCLKQAGRQPSFGFLVTPDGREAFLHKSSVAPDTWALLQSGVYVKFKVLFGEGRGPTAVDVQPTAWVPRSGPDSDAQEEARPFPAT